ncbi:hypothetical protein Tco_1045732 [Tanacetum coccineum]|uniref:Uncharacterized protein n=1 Tax=Tanacetum coccineum TaxID=301880 RepID=A0ABQ5GTN9_9ASTR
MAERQYIRFMMLSKVCLDPKQKDNSELCQHVFPTIANLKGEHLLALVKKDLEFNELDDEDVIRTEVHRFVDEEQVRLRAVDEEDVRPRAVLEQINGNGFENFLVDGLDHKSMEGVSQCMSVDHLDKNRNDKSESVAIDGLICLRSQDVDHISKKSAVVDDHDSKVKDIKNLVILIDVGVSDSMDVDQPSLVNNVLGDVHVDSVVKDGDEIDFKTVVIPFQREKKLSKACLSPYVV